MTAATIFNLFGECEEGPLPPAKPPPVPRRKPCFLWLAPVQDVGVRLTVCDNLTVTVLRLCRFGHWPFVTVERARRTGGTWVIRVGPVVVHWAVRK